jgi:hypothetical protein
MAAERERQFASVVAQEPLAERLDVEPVSRLALVDRRRQLVYVLDPGLVALELRTGKERWRAPGASGDSLWRVGRFLAVGTDGAALPPKVTFVDVEAPERPVSCSLALGAPSVATEAFLYLFDRAGEPYVYWRSNWSYSGGTPPDEAAKAREVRAEACGVLKIDPRTCAASPEHLEDFVWDPPEGRRYQQGEPGFCDFLSPLLDIPAAAASAPRVFTLSLLLMPAAQEIALRVIVKKEPQERGGCSQVQHLSLEARDEASSLLWSHTLQDREENPLCAAP